METSKPLAIESFSYSWLSNNLPPSLDHHRNYPHDGASGSSPEESQSFDFGVSISDPSSALVHADELFLNGLIRPIPAEPSSEVEAAPTHSGLHQPVAVNRCLPARKSSDRMEHNLLRRWRRSSERVLSKFFPCIRPLYRKQGMYMRKSVRVDDINRRAHEVRCWRSAPVSPSHSAASYYSAGECSDVVESSIYEAVLHCKRSIGA